ncbi:integral membrane protein [Candidatus Scalindua japonica]|uniref:Integral membrane protein n=2 Tax=Candidatus Scalindua japonica TaxID=1284222 RepID=A0A286U206_9BACT|nr:integral membrane protein [Candidatus Scalindua japonica]
MYCQPSVILVLVPACLGFSFIYLWHEVNNKIENSNVAFKRVCKIYLRGIIYAIITGTIILDLVYGTFYRSLHGINQDCNNIYMGVIGVINPKVLLVFFPLALLIGIFVQIIWEDKSITQPL